MATWPNIPKYMTNFIGSMAKWWQSPLCHTGCYAHDNSTDKLKFILIIMATDKFRYMYMLKNGWMMYFFSYMFLDVFSAWLPDPLWLKEKKVSQDLSSPFAIIFLQSWYWKASNHVLHFTHGQILAQIRLQEPSCH